MDNVILIRYGELYLKGKNKCVFENKLIANIKAKLSGIACDLHFGRGRYVVKNYAIGDEAEIINRLKHVFGLHSISVAHRCGYDFGEISKLGIEMVPNEGSFRVSAHR